MRPKSTGDGRKINYRILVVGAAIIVAIVGLIMLTESLDPEDREEPYFKEIKLLDGEISPEGETQIHARVMNPTENSYNIKIQLATVSPQLELSYENPAQEEEGEYRLTISPPPLRGHEETKLYVFNVSGDLYPGIVSMTVKIKARVLVNDKITDNRIFNLKIES